MPILIFGNGEHDHYAMKEETQEAAKETIAKAIKSGLPEEARRVDVLCWLFDEMKEWARNQRLNL